MNAHVKVTGSAHAVMTSEGLSLVLAPGEAERLGLREGDEVSVELTREPPASDLEARLARGREFIDRYRETFVELAK